MPFPKNTKKVMIVTGGARGIGAAKAILWLLSEVNSFP
jgi:NAD(P)-dependent dehydrogenase (short-subunit alcohol dehydrogenase family)